MALAYLGQPDSSRQDAKQVVAALKSVKDLKLGDFATGTPPPHAATSLKDALTKWAANDIGTMWALVPTIVRN